MIELPIETLTSIFYFIDEPEQYKHVNLTCSLFNEILNEFYTEKQYNMNNQLTTLLTKFPGKNWNWSHLSKNKCISMDFIISHPELPWDYDDVFVNPNFTMDLWDVISDLRTDTAPLYNDWVFKSYIEGHPTLDIDFVLANHTNCNFDSYIWRLVSAHIDIKYINIFPHFPWNYTFVSKNRTLTPEFIDSHIDEEWDMDNLSQNAHVITPDFIKKHPLMNWNWRHISGNMTTTFEFMLENLDKDLDWSEISAFDDLPICFVFEHLEYDWDWAMVSTNRYITIPLLREFRNIPWNWSYLSSNVHISIEDIISNWFEFPWELDAIAERCVDPNFIVKQFGNGCAVIQWLSYCPKLTLEFVRCVNRTIPVASEWWDWSQITRSLLTFGKYNGPIEKQRQIQSFKSLFENPDLPWDWNFLSHNTFGK